MNTSKQTKIWLLAILFSLLVGCGEAPTTTDPAADPAPVADPAPTTPPVVTPPTTPTSTPTQVTLGTLSATIQSDDGDFATIRATVLDSGFAAVDNATVLFTANGGRLSNAFVVSGIDGIAEVQLSAGPSGINQVVTVTATLADITPTISASVPVSVVGTTISLVSQTTNLADDGSIVDTLDIQVKDSSNNPVYNIPVTLTTSGAGNVSISPASGNTDVSGTLGVSVTGVNAGSVTLTASAAGTTATQTYTVATTGNAFFISSPTQDPFALIASIPLNVSVTVPAGVTGVDFATSLGSWNGTGAAVLLNVAPVAGVATASFLSTFSGTANIEVYDSNNALTVDSTRIAISQPSSAAFAITLQSNVAVVAPSVGGVSNTAILTATVRDITGQTVGGAAVNFTIPQPTGSGEVVSPVITYTDAQGVAQTTFTSGSQSSGAQGIDIYASVIAPAITSLPTNIVVGGTAASIVIGSGTVIQEISGTQYAMPMSVQVLDPNGNGAANTIVTLNVYPKYYMYGAWYSPNNDGTACVPIIFPSVTTGESFIPNEDLNQNLLLDGGEDLTHLVTSVASVDIYGNPIFGAPFASLANDGSLTPASSASGAVPATVTTDANGIANFDLNYLKANAAWIVSTITASAQVFGTEATAVLEYRLQASAPDVAACLLPHSAFNEPDW